jgi:heavy metal sensor kinase
VNTRSLKFRLVTWYAGWLTALFLVFGFLMYESLGYYLKESLREALARRARQVADLVQRSPLEWDALGEEIHSHFAPEANSRLTRVTIDGVVTYVSGPPADQSFDPGAVPPAPQGADGESFGRRLMPHGTALFVVVIRKATPEEHFVIEEGFSEGPIKATLHGWLTALVLGLVLLILGAVLGGFLLVQRALKPVGQIIGSAERLSSRNLSERLPVPGTGDELERLSIALNNMIRRLDDAFQQTRRFLADASHELRTPLTMMRAELEAIRDKESTPGDVREVAASGLEEVERLRKIVEGLFALSRLDAGDALERFVLFDLAEVAASTAEQMCLLAQDKEISLECAVGEKVIVEGDRARLKQVTVNLLDNAIKYTPRGGRINVRVVARDHMAVLEVADNGIGISPEAASHVFERFFRADKARSRELGGAGLGLSIVKSICTAHGGRVDVETKEGEGSRFTVELPLASNGGAPTAA